MKCMNIQARAPAHSSFRKGLWCAGLARSLAKTFVVTVASAKDFARDLRTKKPLRKELCAVALAWMSRMALGESSFLSCFCFDVFFDI